MILYVENPKESTKNNCFYMLSMNSLKMKLRKQIFITVLLRTKHIRIYLAKDVQVCCKLQNTEKNKDLIKVRYVHRLAELILLR